MTSFGDHSNKIANQSESKIITHQAAAYTL